MNNNFIKLVCERITGLLERFELNYIYNNITNLFENIEILFNNYQTEIYEYYNLNCDHAFNLSVRNIDIIINVIKDIIIDLFY